MRVIMPRAPPHYASGRTVWLLSGISTLSANVLLSSEYRSDVIRRDVGDRRINPGSRGGDAGLVFNRHLPCWRRALYQGIAAPVIGWLTVSCGARMPPLMP